MENNLLAKSAEFLSCLRFPTPAPNDAQHKRGMKEKRSKKKHPTRVVGGVCSAHGGRQTKKISSTEEKMIRCLRTYSQDAREEAARFFFFLRVAIAPYRILFVLQKIHNYPSCPYCRVRTSKLKYE